MKFYIAARFGKKKEVERISKLIKRSGHSILSAWIHHPNIKPYEKHPARSKKYAIECIKAMRNCDVFILLTDKEGTGMYTELGAAIMSNLQKEKPKIYIIGDYLSRSMFYFLPNVYRKHTIEKVLRELKNEN